MSEPSRPSPPAFFALLVTGLAFTPVIALLDAMRGGRVPNRLFGRLGVAALGAGSVAAAAWVVTCRQPWTTASLAWSGFVALGSLAVAAAFGLGPREESAAPRPGWARRALVALGLALGAMPPLALFARTLASAALEPALISLQATGTPAPDELMASYGLSALGWIPLGAVFAIRSLRAGRLATPGDLGRAILAWLCVLITTQFLVEGPIAALHRLMIGSELWDPFSSAQRMWLIVLYALVATELTLRLAWGRGVWRWRLLATTLLAVVSLVHIALALGYPPRAFFALARYAERVGRVDAALASYSRTLLARPTAGLEAYLQHRIGLLHYKLGDEARARDSFRLVVTTNNANRELVDQASYYLERLSRPPSGGRVVLPGVELTTESRAAYCAPNSLALVLRYHGVGVTPGGIGERFSLIGGGTAMTDISLAAESAGFDQLMVPFATLADVRWLIDQGYPALLYETGHVFAVFGYDDRLGTVVTYDTSTWDVWSDEAVPDLEGRWADFDFLLGVVVPPHGAEAIRERFASARAEATRRLWLAHDQRGGHKNAQLRAALLADPTYFPAAFQLLRSRSSRDWLAEHVDVQEVAAAARAFLRRDTADADGYGHSLAQWLYSDGRDREILELGEELERRGALGSARTVVGLAAWRQGDRALASRYLNDTSGAGQLLRARLELELGEPARAVAALETLPDAEEEDSELVAGLPLALELRGDRPPAFLEPYLRAYVDAHPWDGERGLLYAELNLESLATEGAARKAERLQRARREALLARAASDDPALQARAAAVLERVAALSSE